MKQKRKTWTAVKNDKHEEIMLKKVTIIPKDSKLFKELSKQYTPSTNKKIDPMAVYRGIVQ